MNPEASTNRGLRALRVAGATAALLALASCSVDKAALAKAIDLQSPSLAAVPDGSYEAAYTIHPPVMAANKSVRVRVTVAGSRYTAVELLEPPGLVNGKLIGGLTSRIVADQALSMDAISSATVTSAAVLKAAQLAVTAGR